MKRIPLAYGVKPSSLPEEIKEVKRVIEKRRAAHTGEHYSDLNDLFIADHQRYGTDETEWSLGSKYEDGSSTTIWYGGEWFYRNPHTGKDRKVPGGREEVIENWMCAITG